MGAALDGQRLGQRHDGGKQCGGQHAGEQDRPEPRHETEQDIGRGGAEGTGDDHRPAALRDVGDEGAKRNGKNAHRHHQRHHQCNLGVRKSPVLQPQRQEGQLDAAAEEQHGIEQR